MERGAGRGLWRWLARTRTELGRFNIRGEGKERLMVKCNLRSTLAWVQQKRAHGETRESVTARSGSHGENDRGR